MEDVGEESTTTNDNIHDILPPELMSLILDRLRPKHMMRARLVCRAWRDLVDSTVTTLRVKMEPRILRLNAIDPIPAAFYGSGMSSFGGDKYKSLVEKRGHLRNLINHQRHISCVQVKDYTQHEGLDPRDNNEAWWSIVSQTGATKLVLIGGAIPSPRYLRLMGRLEELVFIGTTGTGLAPLTRITAEFPRLRALCYQQFFDSETIYNMDRLETLSIMVPVLLGPRLTQHLSKTLRDLTLNCNGYVPPECTQYLGDLTGLTRLSLSGAGVLNRERLQFLPKLVNLRVLVLLSCRATHHNIASLLPDGLRELSIVAGRMHGPLDFERDDGTFSGALQSLTHLSLARTKVTAHGHQPWKQPLPRLFKLSVAASNASVPGAFNWYSQHASLGMICVTRFEGKYLRRAFKGRHDIDRLLGMLVEVKTDRRRYGASATTWNLKPGDSAWEKMQIDQFKASPSWEKPQRTRILEPTTEPLINLLPSRNLLM